MDGNRDAAKLCVEKGEQQFKEGRFQEAEKFFLRANRLYPTERGLELLKNVQAALLNNTNPQPAGQTREPETVRQRPTTTKPTEPEKPDYTPEQVDAVKAIKKCRDFYEMLGVKKDATDSDVKKAYKKLALQFHPDKNKAPGASEAFKAIGNAVAILTDPVQRKRYDACGYEDERPTRRTTNAAYNTHGFESDFTAEELFNMFFGSTGPGYQRREHRFQRATYPHQHTGQGGGGNQGNYSSLLQMLPIILLILLSMMSSLFIADPVYSLTPSHKYPTPRKTEQLKVPYYVTENFHTEYQGSLRRFEMSVEEKYLENLRHACQRERNYRDTMAWKARNFGDKQQFQQMQNMAMPSCEALQSIQVRH